MRRGLCGLTFAAAFCGFLASCVPLVAASGEDTKREVAVQTARGPLRLAFTEAGRGRPILLLHGLGASGFTWRGVMPMLAKSHRVIALDLKGFGASDKPMDGHYSLLDQTRAVEAFIEQEDLRDLTVAGHSFGGGITLELALGMGDRPVASRIRNIVLLDSIAYRQRLPAFFTLLKMPMLAELGMALVPPEVQASEALATAYHDPSKVSPETVAAYAGPLHSPAAKYALMETINSLVPPDIDTLAERYKTLRLPTLVVWCDADRVVPLAFGKRLGEDIPSAELTVLSDCGHLPQEEKPSETGHIIQAFLARHGG
jgi:pimeloyl-ACP methyl ester carboxylesterase